MKKPLSAMHGLLIAVVLFAAIFCTGLFVGESAKAAVGLLVFVTEGVGRNFFAMCLLWIVIFPSYLVVRSRIRAGRMQLREGGRRFGLALLLIPAGVFAVITLGSAALFMPSTSSMTDIWQTAHSQLAAAQSQAKSSVPVQVKEQVSEIAAAPIDGVYVYQNGQGFGEIAVRTDSDGVYLKIETTSTGRQSLSMCQFETEGDTGKAQRTGSMVTWSGDRFGQCKLKMKFSETQAELEQEGECGCGMGVTMDGKYKKATP